MEKPIESTRRDQILETAAQLFGTTGVRTSVQEIARACGILPGSLYHHFDGKEAILVELVRRYQVELNHIAAGARVRRAAADAPSAPRQVLQLAQEMAACSIRHRAAVLQSLFEPAAGASDELIALTSRPPTSIDDAMLEILRAGEACGEIRADVELAHLTDRICQAMLAMGLGLAQGMPGAEEMPTLKCRMLLEGLAAATPDDRRLDRSAAFAVAQAVIAGWGREELDDRTERLRRAARRQFGRHGFDATTIRDIAAAAGMSPSMAHHLAGSKDELLAAIMETYTRTVAMSWDAVLAAPASPVERLDALIWININVMDRFSDEFKIQMASLQQTPPSATDLGPSRRSARIAALMAEGETGGHLRVLGGSADLRAQCLLELSWISERIVRTAGPRAALALARDTLLRGACVRPDAAGD